MTAMREIALEHIAADQKTLTRLYLNEGVVDEYVEALAEGAKFPPIVVFNSAEKFWVSDGHHRLEAARRSKRKTIACEVRAGTLRDAVLHSCGANSQHGLRRSSADKRLAVTRLLEDEEWSRWSNREIARRCQVSPGLVDLMRAEQQAQHLALKTRTAAPAYLGSAQPRNVMTLTVIERKPDPPDPRISQALEDRNALYALKLLAELPDTPDAMLKRFSSEQLQQAMSRAPGAKRWLDAFVTAMRPRLS